MLANVHVMDELADTLNHVEYVQECGPERLDLKRKIFDVLFSSIVKVQKKRCFLK